MKILVIRFSSIGDIVLTTPVVRALKSQLDEVEVHYATKARYRSIVEANPYVDKVLVLENSLWEFIEILRYEKYDWIIDLHNNLRTRIVKTMLGVKSRSFNKLNWEKWLMVNWNVNKLPATHIVDRYLETLKPFDIRPDALGLDFFIEDKDIVPQEWLPESHQKEYVAYAIGAQHNTKNCR
jgi:ADP-heptose:LPS heptosyltransferase